MHNRHTELQMQFSVDKEIKDFNNLIDFRKCSFPHQLSPSGNQGTRQYNYLNIWVSEKGLLSLTF